MIENRFKRTCHEKKRQWYENIIFQSEFNDPQSLWKFDSII